MGNFCTHLWRSAFRPKTVDTSSSDLKQELTLVDLVPIGLSNAVGVSGCILVGTVITEFTGPSIVLAVLLATLAALLTGCVCSELGCRMPRTGGIYTHIYACLGELPALVVSACLLFDLIVLSALAARGISEYIEVVTDGTYFSVIKKQFPQVENSAIFSEHIDFIASSSIVLAMIFAIFFTKLLCQISTVCVGFSILVISAVAFTSLIKANVNNWISGNGFFAHGIENVLTGSSLIGHTIGGWSTTSIIGGETVRYSRIAPTINVALPMIVLLLFFPLSAGITLNTVAVPGSAYLANLFSGSSLFIMRVFVTLGVCIGLYASIIANIIVASRLLNCLARDNLAPSFLSRVSLSRATPWAAVVTCSVLSALLSAVTSTWLLSRISGVGGLSVGVAGSLAVISRRYSPITNLSIDLLPSKDPSISEMQHVTLASSSYTTPSWPSSYKDDEEECEISDEPKDISVKWKKGRWVSSLIENHHPPSHSSYHTTCFLLGTYIANCMVGAAVARYAGILGFWWAIGGAVLCTSGCLVSVCGIWLQPRQAPPVLCRASPGMPFLPLLSALINTFLLFYLPHIALMSGAIISSLSFVGWLVRGYRNSIEAILSRALLSRNLSFQRDSL